MGFEAGDVNLYAYVGGDPINMIDPSGMLGVPRRPYPADPFPNENAGPCPSYGDRYLAHLDQYLINVGPYAVALFAGVWPKSLSPATGGRRVLLGSRNPLTSVPRGFGVPGAGAAAARLAAGGIGVATVAIGYYNVGTFISVAFYAIPSYCDCQPNGGGAQ